MTKPKRLTSEARREQIVRCAERVFAEHGLLGTKTRDIAKACGINESVLYAHFRTKEDLFIEAVGRIHARADAAMQRTADRCSTGGEALREVMKLALTVLCANPHLCTNMLHTLASSTSGERFRKFAADLLDRHRQVWIEVIKRGVRDGSLRGDLIPEEIVRYVQGSVWMSSLNVVTGRSPKTKALIKQHLNAIDKFLVPKP